MSKASSKSTQPGLEVVSSGEAGDGLQVAQLEKEVVSPGEYASQPGMQVSEAGTEAAQAFMQRHDPAATSALPTREERLSRRVCGLKRKVFWGVIIAVVVIVIGLGVGLGVGLSSASEDSGTSEASTSPSTASGSADSSPTTTAQPSIPVVSRELQIGGSLDPSYYSDEGVWNGTGLSQNWQSFLSNYGDAPSDGQSLVIYYQHHTGVLRWMRLTNDGDWVRGSSDSEVVATDAKNSTPISAVSYTSSSGNQQRHIFYINEDYQVSQRSGGNYTMSWSDGTINDENLSVYQGDLIGLEACTGGPNISMRLWYASDNTTFEEYTFQEADNEWTWQKSWHNYSGAAGVGCYSWGSDGYVYATLINLNNELELWYRDETDLDPDGWRQGDLVIQGVHPASSVSVSNHFIVIQKDDTRELQVSKMNWDGGLTSRNYSRSYSLEEWTDSKPGTHVIGMARFESGVDTAFVYCQVNGDDITEFQRPLNESMGSWTRNDRAFRD